MHTHLLVKCIQITIVSMALSSCLTMIGPDIKSEWNCGESTAETKNANCSITNSSSDYAKIFGTYSGPVLPVRFNQAVPHGWGKVIYNKRLVEVNFIHGVPKKAKINFDNGSTFDGEVHENMRPKKGSLNTKSYTYNGTFFSNGNHQKGTLTYKASKNKFSGTYKTINDNFYPDLGTFYYNAGSCIVEYYGNFVTNNANEVLKLDKNKSFKINHPNAKISKVGNSVEVEFAYSEYETLSLRDVGFSDDEGYLVNNIKTNSKSLSFNRTFGDIYSQHLEWKNIRKCDSEPILSEDLFLSGVTKRALVTDDSVDYRALLDFGFTRYKNIPKDTKQALILKFLDSKYERKITNTFTEKSKYISETREIYNPAYDRATMELYDARDRLSRARSHDAELDDMPCYESIMKCAFLKSLASKTGDAEKKYEAALAKLERTPRTKKENIYSEYNVEKLKIHAKKSSTLKVTLMDFDNDDSYEINIPYHDEKKFTVINSPIATSDKNKWRLAKNTSTEKDVDAWMNSPFKYEDNILKLLLELKLPENKLKLSWYKSQNAYLDSIFNDNLIEKKDGLIKDNFKNIKKNKALYEVEDSILVIDTLNGMGSGFFIKKNHVMTNQHVVDDSSFVSLRNRDGQKFTGQVVARDISTDLAIIKVSHNGIPLDFEDDCQVKRRESIFTVGHPKGYEYTTSRGIVSSIREMENPFYKAAGLKKYIQIDAPISSGNSGGPLFNSDERVIGVNTWGRVDGQNLNFAIHCKEVKKFIYDNL